MIKIKGLNKYYNKNKNNEIHVINNTDLELPSIGLVSFLGASGSGKTTLLNVIGGLDKAYGNITYDQKTFVNYKSRQIDNFRMKNIGYIFQNYNLLPNLSVYQNIELSLKLIGITDEQEIEKRIEYCLNSVKMLKFKKRKALALSGGQQQRVSIARALAKDAKIIIADEPTGNLDSQNSIEVMNILRKISQTKLVLLVTHDKDLASFYSDKIVELKDGKITSYHDNELLFQSLDIQKTNDIYLKDLKEDKVENKYANLTVYQDEETEEKLDLVVVFKNNTIYLKSNKANIKMIDVNTEVKLINESFKKIDEQQVSNYEFDTSDFNNVVKNKFIDFKAFFNNFRIAFINFFNVRKRGKFLYLCLILIGFLLSNSIVSYSIASKLDLSNKMYVENAYIVYNDEVGYDNNLNRQSAFQEACNQGIITSFSSFYAPIQFDLSFLPTITQKTMFETEINAVYCDFRLLEDEKVLAGSKNIINNDQIILSKTIADRLIENSKDFASFNYKSLIGIKTTTKTVIGIVDIDGNSVYVNDTSVYFTNKLVTFYDDGLFDYEVVFGNDFSNSFRPEVLVNIALADIDLIGGTVKDEFSLYYTVVGYFTSEEVDASYIFNYSMYYMSDMYQFLEKDKVDYTIISGREPKNMYEVLVHYKLNFEVYSEININGITFMIVGKYFSKSGETRTLGDQFLTIASSLAHGQNSRDFLVFTNNPEKLKEIFKEYGFEVELSKDYHKNIHKETFKTTNLAIYATSASLFLVVIVYIFFLMRTKMINKIYDIGVYRALGAKKSKIVSKFIYDLLVTTTLTSLLGYLVGMIFYYLASKVPLLGSPIYINVYYSVIGFVLLYILNVFFGLLPIIMLLRKTPSEIIAKYDI